MPDLRERFDYGAVLDSVNQPGFDELRREAGRRRTRRTALVAGVGVAAAVLVGTAVPNLQRPAPPTPPGDPRLQALGVVVADARHAFALYKDRNESPGRPELPGESPRDHSCTLVVRATDDGGRTWSEPRNVPCGTAEHGDPTTGVIPVDADTLLRQDADKLYISHDAGRTWAAHTLRRPTVETFPERARLETSCDGDCTLTWFDPQTGNRTRLGNGPGLDMLRNVVRATDGSVWVAGYTEDGRYAVAITRDNGRTWRTRPLEIRGEVPEGPVVAVADGRAGYLVVADDEGARREHVIFRTDDGGETWHRVNTGVAPIDQPGRFGAFVATDGTLLVRGGDRDSGHRWYASRDGGESFTAATDVPPFDVVVPLPGGYLGEVGSYQPDPGADPSLIKKREPREPVTYLSEDGLRWRKVVAP